MPGVRAQTNNLNKRAVSVLDSLRGRPILRLPAELLPGVAQIPEAARIPRDAVDDRPGHVLDLEAAGDQLGAVAPAQPDGAQPVPRLLLSRSDQRDRRRWRRVVVAHARRRTAGRRTAENGTAPCTTSVRAPRRALRARTASRAGSPPCGRSSARRRGRRSPGHRRARTCRRRGSTTRTRRVRPPPGAPPRRRCTCRRCCCEGRRPRALRAQPTPRGERRHRGSRTPSGSHRGRRRRRHGSETPVASA